MLQNLELLIQNANPNYEIFYEESRMYNVDADELPRDGSFCHIEEFVDSTFIFDKYWRESVSVQLYIFKICEMQNTANERESIRTDIKGEIVFPLCELLKSDRENQIKNVRARRVISKFDCNDTGFLVEFNYIVSPCVELS